MINRLDPSLLLAMHQEQFQARIEQENQAVQADTIRIQEINDLRQQMGDMALENDELKAILRDNGLPVPGEAKPKAKPSAKSPKAKP